ncbi:MAG TPA: MerR family transcriptional regulator [Solirubrobacteraceae bacterium]|nr:MerR family transcriptional regulator [Solirubrobacteraceae bacterium]
MPSDRAESPNQLTIEELAARSGMTVRNIRSHQARGLLSPPEVRVRVGYYGPDHLAQLQMIRHLQGEGFNLGGIKRLMEDTEGTAERLLRFKSELSHLAEEPRERLTVGELGRRFRVPQEVAPAVLARAEALGVLVPAGEGVYEVPSPSLLAVAEEAMRGGVDLGAALDVFEQLEQQCDAAARSFVELFVTQVWRPFQEADMPAERWPELDEATQRLLPLASGALLAIFQRRMRQQIGAAFAQVGVEGGAG